MRSHALLLLVTAIGRSTTYLLPPTNDPSCYDNLWRMCDGKGFIQCCTTQGFIYCGWTNGTFAWTRTHDPDSYCHTTTGPPDGLPYLCFGEGCSVDNSTSTVLYITHVDDRGWVLGNTIPGAGDVELWNILVDNAGYQGDVP
jgi:hypothetical protein